MTDQDASRQVGTATALGLIAVHQLMYPAPAAAYVDPISGSIVLQVLAAAVLGGIVGVRRWWDSITAFCRRVFGRAPE